MKTWRIGVCLAVLLVVTVAQADFDSAVGAYRAGDYEAALQAFSALAEQGEPRAYAYLGFMFDLGYGVEEDKEEAARWYEKAIEAQGLSTDFLGWAQANLALLYWRGDGVTKDMARGVELFRQAAIRNQPRAQANLGFALERGLGGVEQNAVEAMAWYLLAIINGVDAVLENGRELKKQLDAQQLATALGRAAELTQQIAAEVTRTPVPALVNPLGDPFVGTFRGDELTLELSGENGKYTGRIVLGEQSFPVTAQSEGVALRGSFEVGGSRFEFSADLLDNAMTLETGGRSYALTRQALGDN